MPPTSPSSGAEPPYPNLAARRLAAFVHRLRGRLREAYWQSALYRARLKGPMPMKLRFEPAALTPARLDVAQGILNGRFLFPSGKIESPPAGLFTAAAAGPEDEERQRFGFLTSLAQAGGREAAQAAYECVNAWLQRHDRPGGIAWRPDLCAARALSWAAHFGFLVQGRDVVARSRILKSLAEQARHAARTLDTLPNRTVRAIAALDAAVLAAALDESFSDVSKALRTALEALAAGARDGAALTRRHDHQIALTAGAERLLRALVEIGLPPSPALDGWRAALGDSLALLRFEDQRLVSSGHGDEGPERLLGELASTPSPQDGPSLRQAPGFVRLDAAGTNVLFDAGDPPPFPEADGASAGALGISFADGSERVVVHCGPGEARGGEWIEALRRTAAHSAPELGGVDAGGRLSGAAAAALGAQWYGGAMRASAQAAAEGLWAEAAHDLYAARFAATLTRRVYLDATGADLRGEDRIERTKAGAPIAFALRFHLHPDCRAALEPSGDAAVLTLASGRTWRFRAAIAGLSANLVLEPSLYLGAGAARRTQCLTLSGAAAAQETVLRWAFKRDAEGQTPRPSARLS